MLSGISAYNGSFLADLNQTETRISQDEQQISSGIRVSQASDDPAAVSSILDYQEEIDHVTQVQTNLNSAAGTASAADSALQTASKLLDQLASIGGEGASTLASPTSQASLASQVQQIAQQMAGLANTTSQGQYVFGSDGATTQPYTFNWADPKGIVQNSTAGNTSVLRDASGNPIVPAMTAQQIFDVQNPDGTSATGNVFQAIYDLGTALARPNFASFGAGNTVNLNTATGLLAGATQTYTFQIGTQSLSVAVSGGATGISGAEALKQLNSSLAAHGITANTDSNGAVQFSGTSAFTVSDGGPSPASANGVSNETSGMNITSALNSASTQAAIASATQEIQDAVAQIGTATTTYGNTENWIQSAQTDASDRLVTLKTGLSSLQDADVAAVATQLTTDNTALEASMSAHASLSNKSLFSYLG